ncbi:unnamed protein product [Ceutorhynchus assimilis]|uniref:WH2 domain-containing protein n=1 Tax=Ceutorhynchus assimilis TaxID=467358 RepID=A0A9P0DDZ6_9CUCU|nr:unnamed protein product [Ceutorhynchus assimilis]
MIQITEDTPPDMLAGAMDLTVHLPNGKAVKMPVERSTPMMDLLVQITTANQLQLSTHTLQVLGMAPSSEHNDKILPFKPNTPIGTLDTQHIRVLLKGRTLPALKYPAPGHQPFESTFRLKVHLPRNQLYVTRVSRHVLLEDIMKKVCEEKNLDPVKYDFKHPGNLDEVLDPKLTLSDYQITEIYVVAKGTTNLNQAFSAADIMVLRKEEERKQMHNKTGGGVFNLIFKRGKSSMGSGSVSSDNRSISPTHSDDSRSVTPPAVQAPPIVAPPKKDPPPERPKPPQRKRRPAPKPPQIRIGEAGTNEHEDEKSSSVISNEVALSKKTIENGLTICHSRNGSDSSGYHEASILSDHCANASLPRARPKSAFVGDLPVLQSSSNLTKMTAHSRSMTSLVAGRKKKAAPPPPPVAASPESPVVAPESEKPSSPLVASQSPIAHESITSSSNPLDSIPPCPLDSPPIADSTDSGIAADKEKDIEEDFEFCTPPPPPDIFSEASNKEPTSDQLLDKASPKEIEAPEEFSSLIVEETIEAISVSTAATRASVNEVNTPATTTITAKVVTPTITAKVVTPTIAAPHPVFKETTPERELKTSASFTEISTSPASPVSTTATQEITQKIPEPELSEIDWQYQLPSPPKAFRDSSPSINDTNSIVSDFKDSVVTSPELFEKLKSLEDNYSEADTLKSEETSIASEEPLNTLSLEHLEKRKSLVYNRELATSLKMTDSIGNSNKSASSLDKNHHHNGEFQTKQPQKPVRTSNMTLPNFKITTYDVPKQNIKVFEDDTIRSNTLSRNNPNHQSMDNIAFIKKQSEEREYKFYKPKPPSTNVSRSESFSTDRTLAKPVSRSKSTLTLNKYQPGKRDETNNISRSNSFFDVSGLQSLEVMKLIQNKLNTPPGSAEDINTAKTDAQSQVPQEPPSKIPSPEPIKKYYYRGPPAVNMSTWSERPKVPVAVKEDEDYKLGKVSSKLIVNTTNNNVTSNNSVEVKQEQITQNSGNVVIKIGSSNNYSKNLGPIGYRKPFGNVNQNNPRPHSIALPTDFDISRVPVVRSVEYKKPFKDLNTSITHLNQGNDDFRSLHYFSNSFKSTENLRSIEKQDSEPNKRVFRVGSFKPADNQQQPVVRGFKNNNDIKTNNRLSWNPSTTYNTLPSKPKTVGPNQHVPFSQLTLRRTDSSKIYASNNHNIIENNDSYNSLPPNYASKIKVASPPPPPPPQMPKIIIKTSQSNMINNNVDPRDMLLESIRNFGGKRGLKNVSA